MATHTSYGKLTITAIRFGHPGQNKPSALEKVEILEKLERIGGQEYRSKRRKWTDVIDVRGKHK